MPKHPFRFKEKLVMPYLKFFLTALFLLLSPHIGLAQNIYINEFLASNVRTNPDILDFDDYSDWLELYNAEAYPVNLSGYYLTDDINDPTKWPVPEGTTIPARGYLLFWADDYDDQPGNHYTRKAEPFARFTTQYYHLNFKLSKGGETLGLFSPDGVQVDVIEYGLQITDVSFGRKPDGSPNLVFFGEPTPEKSNTTPGTLSTENAGDVIFPLESGFYSGSEIISIQTASFSSAIRYTLDGSRPTQTSARYITPLMIDKNTVIRARTFAGDKLPGPIETRTYFINENPSIATLSISVFPDVMFGTEKGIYPLLLKDREIPITAEFFEPNRELGFRMDAGVKLSGQASFNYPQKPLTIYFRDRWGTEQLNYPVFPSREKEKFKAIYLRNSGSPDNRMTLFRDALQHSIVINRMDLDLQAYRPAATFINGNYWGIYNIRDKINADYLAALHNVDPNNLDLLEYDFNYIPVEIEGDAENYNHLLNYLKTHDITVAANYDYLKSQIDIDEYINYQITEIYCDNINWLDTNVKWWRERTEKGKWRWILLDMDWGFGTPWQDFSSDVRNRTLEMAVSTPGNPVSKRSWATFLFRKLLENDDFKNEFIQRFASHLNTTFHRTRVVQITDSLQANIQQEMNRHIDRWNDDLTPVLGGDLPIADMAEWNSNVRIMRNFAEQRQNIQTQQIVDFFKLSGTAKLELQTSSSESGKITVNDVEMPLGIPHTYFKDVPVSIKAVPAVGFRFVSWQGASNAMDDSISLTLNTDSELTAVFRTSLANFLPEEIRNTTTLTADHSPYLAHGDVTVAEEATLHVQPGVEIRMPDRANIIIKGKLWLSGSADQPVVIAPNEQAGVQQWGALCFDNAVDSSHVSWLQLKGATHGRDPEKFKGALSAYKSKINLEHVEITDAAFPVFAQFGQVKIAHCVLSTEKTADLINVKYAESAIVENCDLSGYDAYDTDAIDFDQIKTGIIRGNRIYNFTGFNNDGIDLGERCLDVLIENNLIFNCFDKGISVGQASKARVKNNVIVNCGQGMGIKDTGSYALIDRNTFYGNTLGIAVFEKNVGAGGGSADVVNSLFTRSVTSPIFVDELSTLNVTYSISDKIELPGPTNLFGDPRLTNEFRLQPTSPAIDAGDPGSAKDPDQSTADLGAYPFNQSDNYAIFINEIHYNPANGAGYEFIELYNASARQIDLAGYKLDAAVKFTFPAGSQIQSGEYIIVAKNRDIYANNASQAYSWDAGELQSNDFTLTLQNADDELLDFVNYTSRVNWPSSANGLGSSLELRATHLENLYFANWRASSADGGSPGKANMEPLHSGLFINEIMAKNSSFIRDENDEFDDWIEIYNDNDHSIDIGGLYLTDDFADPTRYQIPTIAPDKTRVQPNDFILLWADDEPDQGVLHLGFKIGSAGEQIGLAQKVNGVVQYIDHIGFNTQPADVSIGRLPDGSDNFGELNYPTPATSNNGSILLQSGILLVNGVSFETYGDEITSAYFDKAFSGDFPFTFWDCFYRPESGYPNYLPEPMGNGPVPKAVLFRYSTVIWVGNNYDGDLSSWEETPILDYLQLGGNVILLTRFGNRFLTQDLTEYLGISWQELNINTNNCTAIYPGLKNMVLSGQQTLVALFAPVFTNTESKLLFTEAVSFDTPRGLGVWRKPSNGGKYNPDGGQFVFISGRPYRYNAHQLRENMAFILENFMHESKTNGIEDDNDLPIVRAISLKQNYPNPFNPKTTIQFLLPKTQHVSLKIYDIRGTVVRTLLNGRMQEAGNHTIVWDGKNNSGVSVSSGEYFYKLEADKHSASKKMLLLK